jgi:CBS-domain-containing membrane protein
MTANVGELAIPLADYPHVDAGATLREVFATLQQRYDSAEQFRSVLMIDASGHLLGMLGLRDLLHALLPDYLRNAPTNFQGAADNVAALAMLWQEDCEEQCRTAGTLQARSHLTPVKSTLKADDPLAKAVFLFATEAVNILPVVAGGKVTGVLRLVDVLAEVSRAVQAQGGAA